MATQPVTLDDILTLEQAVDLSAAQGVPLHRRQDLTELCHRGLIPAAQRARVWWMTRPTILAVIARLRGLSFAERQALYERNEVLVPADTPGSSFPPGLLLGYKEIGSFCASRLGWQAATATLMKYGRRFAHRHIGRIVVTTEPAIEKLFQDIWTNKLRLAGVPTSASPGNTGATALTVLRVVQLLLGQRPGTAVGEAEVAVLRQALAAAETARKEQEAAHGGK